MLPDEEISISKDVPVSLKEKLFNYAEERTNYELSYFDTFPKDGTSVDSVREWIKDHIRLSCIRAYERGVIDYVNQPPVETEDVKSDNSSSTLYSTLCSNVYECDSLFNAMDLIKPLIIEGYSVVIQKIQEETPAACYPNHVYFRVDVGPKNKKIDVYVRY